MCQTLATYVVYVVHHMYIHPCYCLYRPPFWFTDTNLVDSWHADCYLLYFIHFYNYVKSRILQKLIILSHIILIVQYYITGNQLILLWKLGWGGAPSIPNLSCHPSWRYICTYLLIFSPCLNNLCMLWLIYFRLYEQYSILYK